MQQAFVPIVSLNYPLQRSVKTVPSTQQTLTGYSYKKIEPV